MMKQPLCNPMALAVIALAFPISALADLSDTKTLTATQSLNLDTDATGPSGGDILWNGSSLTPQGAAKAAILPGLTGSSTFAGLTQGTLQVILTTPGIASSAAIPSSSLPTGTIIAVMTNAGRPAKVLVTAIGSSITLQFTTFGATSGGGGGGGAAPTISRVTNNSSDIPSGFPNSGISQGALFKVVGSGLANDGDATLHDSQASGGLPTTLNGATITVTVGGTTVNVALYYATPTQIDGVLPANTPTGSGTLTVTHNGTASATILIVAAAPGITTYNTPRSCAAPSPAQILRVNSMALSCGKRPHAAQQRGQVFAVQVLHGEEVRALSEANVVHTAHVGVRYLPSDSHLVAEARQRSLVHVRRAHEFQRYGLIKNEIVGAIYLAHTALSEQAEYPLAAPEHRTGYESAPEARRQRCPGSSVR